MIGSAAVVVLATAGSTNSVRTISAHLLTYGEQPSGVVILERRYGPRRLRDDDDDDIIRAELLDCLLLNPPIGPSALLLINHSVFWPTVRSRPMP